MLLRNDMFDCTGYYFHFSAIAVFCDCRGELHISFSKANESAIIVYEHNGHSETPKFAITEEKGFPPRQIYQKLIQMADDPQFEKTELHTITRQQVYNVWLSFTRQEWERDAANDFRSAQLLVSRPKLTEVFIDSTFGTNKHGYELYCVLTEYDLAGLHPNVVHTDKDFAGI
ncbi:hypothetical protein V1524DRAFT_449322 [Lipomyces starkeyi]